MFGYNFIYFIVCYWAFLQLQEYQIYQLHSIKVSHSIVKSGLIISVLIGKIFAVQADKLYFLQLDDESIHDIKSVQGGIGVCMTSSALYVVSSQLLTLVNLKSGKILKTLFFLDETISDLEQQSSTTTTSVSNIESNTKTDIVPANLRESTLNSYFRLNRNDLITSCSISQSGKKMFIGTKLGKLLLFDCNTFGLLSDLTLFDETLKDNHDFGSIIGLHYSERDSIIIAIYSNGSLKAYSGIFRNPGYDANTKKNNQTKFSEDFLNTATTSSSPTHSNTLQAYSQNQKLLVSRLPPMKPILLKSNSYNLVNDNSIICTSFSEDINAIAIGNNHGIIWIYDYITFIVQNIFSIPMSSIITSNVKLTDICFLNHLSAIVTSDTSGRVTLWQCYPSVPSWLYTWSPNHCNNNSNSNKNQFHSEKLHAQQHTTTNHNNTHRYDSIEANSSITHLYNVVFNKKSKWLTYEKPTSTRYTMNRRITTNHNNSAMNSPLNSPYNSNPMTFRNEVTTGYHKIWYIYLINKYGRIIIQDITSILNKTNLLKVLYNAQQSDMLVYNKARRTHILDGCKLSKNIIDVERYIKEVNISSILLIDNLSQCF